MTPYLSRKLTFFSFWLMALVVLLHSLNVDISRCNNILCDLEYLLSHKLSQIAVPLFFLMSGYLYFHKTEVNQKVNLQFFLKANKKRTKTVLIPFILWCTFWFFAVYFAQYLPVLKNYFSEPLHEMSIKDQLLNLYYYPLNYPFWFLLHLMTLFIISPLIFFLIKYMRWFFLILIFAIFVSIKNLIELNSLTILSSSPFFYFSLGSFLALFKIELNFKAKKHIAVILILIWISLNVFSLLNDKNNIDLSSMLKKIFFTKDLLGCLAIWYLYDLLNQKSQWKNCNFYKYSFFIFAFHGIPTVILTKISISLSKNDPLLLFVSYFFIGPLVILLSIFSGMIVKKTFPNFYNILVGARK